MTSALVVLLLFLASGLAGGCQARQVTAALNGSPEAAESPSGAVFYVDDQAGDDALTGHCRDIQDSCGPWRTLTKINGTIFHPGDRILLKSGGVWPGPLHPLGSGSEAHPITLASFGSGPRPVVQGGGTLDGTGAVYLLDQEYWTVRGLEVTNQAATRDETYRGGILMENRGGGTLHDIRILDNDVHDVTSSYGYQKFHDPHQYGGIAVYVSSTTATDKFAGVLVQDNTVSSVGRTGIVVWDELWSGPDDASRDVHVSRNQTTHTDGDGLLLFGIDGGTLEYNTASYAADYACDGCFNHNVGMFTTRGRHFLVQYNEAYNTRKAPGNGDGLGFDADVFSTDTVVQYNYSHDNAGGGYFVCQDETSHHTVVRYNISQNDGGNGPFAFGCLQVADDLQVYNNVFYLDAAKHNNVVSNNIYGCPSCDIPYLFKNNIFYALGSGGYQLPGSAGVFDANVFYGAPPPGSTADAHLLTSDPLLVGPGTGGVGLQSVDGYKLQAGSPALGSGSSLPGDAAYDYWGTPLPESAARNRGLYAGPGVAPN